jgi:hypothetical protein
MTAEAGKQERTVPGHHGGGPRSDIPRRGPGAEARAKVEGYPPAVRAAWPSSTPSPPGSRPLRRDACCSTGSHGASSRQRTWAWLRGGKLLATTVPPGGGLNLNLDRRLRGSASRARTPSAAMTGMRALRSAVRYVSRCHTGRTNLITGTVRPPNSFFLMASDWARAAVASACRPETP